MQRTGTVSERVKRVTFGPRPAAKVRPTYRAKKKAAAMRSGAQNLRRGKSWSPEI